ncbi:aldehyde dehydrogenase [Amycolatopsis sp. K13G38]|uniref:Aldehyde dehydrogenase n=1 Tax=Amycolatopsis acididurans TaxID=2724524 RepID=A0ABX1J099_9PSEU|nr:aldehyde dehydrogenase family protein [Amycolatopsis acididurans]NKQ53203.1 aldehyde dehydrogenase [Amycolatopsis acididurans]
MLNYRNFIDGDWRESSRPSLAVDDPSTGAVIGSIPDSGAEEIDAAVTAARRAFSDGPWARMAPTDRAQVLRDLATVLESRFDELVDGLISDTGCSARMCPMLQAGAPLAHLRDFAEMAPLLEKPVPFPIQSSPGFGQWELHREPVGVVGAFTPYNFPLFIAVWKAAPALLAGNTVVLKPSPLTPYGLDAFALAAKEAGLPDGVVNVVHGDREAGTALVEHAGVDLVTFTGSTAVGKRVMSAAAGTAKEVILEMGGKSPAVVLPDADIELAVRGTLFSSMMHGGQACVATTRMLVPDSRYEEFLEALARRANQLVVGPAAEFTTDVGPVVSQAQREKVEKYVSAAVEQGGRVIAGGDRPAGVPEGGHYVAPTVLADLANDNIAAREEIFGPVLSVLRYSDVDDAIRIANDTQYGLAAAVWSSDVERARSVAARLQSGLTWINDVAQAEVARTPFAGKKQSGVGTELGADGLFGYTKVKSLYTALDENLDARPYGAVGSEWE